MVIFPDTEGSIIIYGEESTGNDERVDLRVSRNFSASAAFGLRWAVGLQYITFELQGNYLINNVVKRVERHGDDMLKERFFYVDDDFGQLDVWVYDWVCEAYLYS